TVIITANDGAPDHMEDDPDNVGSQITVSHTATVVMTINVTETDEDPVFTMGEMSHTYAENKVDTSGDPDLTVYRFAAYDPEDADVSFTLSGVDMDVFETLTAAENSTDDTWDGTLTFASAPDYENPADDNGDNVYEVTLTASSGTGADEKETTINVTVEVTNQQDAGSLELSARQPRIGVPISAINLSDLDGPVSGVSYQWIRDARGSAASPATDCTDAGLTWENAEGDGATTDTYTPELPDDGKCLRARATYTDPEGNGSAIVTSSQSVQKARNLAPKFEDEVGPRYVVENAAVDALVIADVSGDGVDDAAADNDRVIAADNLDAEGADDSLIVYSLSGADAKYFDVSDDPDGGQISVSAVGAGMLDYETRRTYAVTVTAADLEGLRDSTQVIINIVDVNEGPEIMEGRLAVSGEPLIPYDSMGTEEVATYTAVGVDAAGASWSLSGDDAGDFGISTGGVLTFNTPPDYNNPEDNDKDNVYMVTVEATSGDNMASKQVTVTVGIVVAPGERTSLDQYTNEERFDLNEDGIVDASEVRQVLRIWALDNPGN
ncbi:MAG: cadherin repeat domain-containing protein, partial [Dehalococcoidia bacterium]|nr:cadherin repeat domain-containing protein [Dehalococcoidia bacterium]